MLWPPLIWGPQVRLVIGTAEASWKRSCDPLLSCPFCPCQGPPQVPTSLWLWSEAVTTIWDWGGVGGRDMAGEHSSPEGGLRKWVCFPPARLMGKSQEKSWAPTRPPPRPFTAPPTWPSLPATDSYMGTALWRKPFGRLSSLAKVSWQVKVKTGIMPYVSQSSWFFHICHLVWSVILLGLTFHVLILKHEDQKELWKC